MNGWYEWIQNLALERIDQIERDLISDPSLSPRFTEIARKLDAEVEKAFEHPDKDLSARDTLWTDYSAALALEMYLAGARDGGRVYHAFITGELPTIQKQEESRHEQTDA